MRTNRGSTLFALSYHEDFPGDVNKFSDFRLICTYEFEIKVFIIQGKKIPHSCIDQQL